MRRPSAESEAPLLTVEEQQASSEAEGIYHKYIYLFFKKRKRLFFKLKIIYKYYKGSNTALPESNSLRERAKKALALHKAQHVFATSKKTHLEDAGNFSSIMLQISLSVPYLWARRDHKDRKAVL